MTTTRFNAVLFAVEFSRFTAEAQSRQRYAE